MYKGAVGVSMCVSGVYFLFMGAHLAGIIFAASDILIIT